MTTQQTQAQPETRPSEVRSDALLAQIEAMKNCDNCKHQMNTVGYCALCNRVPNYKTAANKDRMMDRWELIDSANRH